MGASIGSVGITQPDKPDYNVTIIVTGKVNVSEDSSQMCIRDRAGVRVSLCTAKPEIYARQILEHFDILRYFDYVKGASLDASLGKKRDIIRCVLDQDWVTGRCAMAVSYTHLFVVIIPGAAGSRKLFFVFSAISHGGPLLLLEKPAYSVYNLAAKGEKCSCVKKFNKFAFLGLTQISPCGNLSNLSHGGGPRAAGKTFENCTEKRRNSKKF